MRENDLAYNLAEGSSATLNTSTHSSKELLGSSINSSLNSGGATKMVSPPQPPPDLPNPRTNKKEKRAHARATPRTVFPLRSEWPCFCRQHRQNH